MKISHNAEQATPSGKISSQTVQIKDKTNKKKPYLEQNISNPKLDGSDQKTNTNTLSEMKISYNVKQSTSSGENNSQTVEIKDKTNEKKPYLEQNISNHKLDTSHKKVNTKTSPEIKIFHNVEQDNNNNNNNILFYSVIVVIISHSVCDATCKCRVGRSIRRSLSAYGSSITKYNFHFIV